jgi:hypothetical protein
VNCVHRPNFKLIYKHKTQRFGNWISFHLQVRGRRQLLFWVAWKELISITGKRSSFGNVAFSSYLEFRTMDKVLTVTFSAVYPSFCHKVHACLEVILLHFAHSCSFCSFLYIKNNISELCSICVFKLTGYGNVLLFHKAGVYSCTRTTE